MIRGVRTYICLFALALTSAVVAQRDVGDPSMRMLLLRNGLRSIVKNGDLSQLGEHKQQQYAARVGLDLTKPQHPMLLANCQGGRVYFMFFKAIENAFSDRSYAIQRIKKIERTWATKNSEPTEVVTYQVEVFKLLGGAIKRPDRHFGYFPLRDNYRREIIK